MRYTMILPVQNQGQTKASSRTTPRHSPGNQALEKLNPTIFPLNFVVNARTWPFSELHAARRERQLLLQPGHRRPARELQVSGGIPDMEWQVIRISRWINRIFLTDNGPVLLKTCTQPLIIPPLSANDHGHSCKHTARPLCRVLFIQPVDKMPI
jgi:hypothetical protein